MEAKKEVKDISNWIKERFDKAHRKIAIIGISGGVDSAVTAGLCAEALGPDNVIGIILPCDSPEEDKELALKVIDTFKINSYEMDLEPTLVSFVSDYGSIFKKTIGNVKARLRMTALYAFSEENSGLVVGTTNLTEATIGYMTKYGDGGVDLEPLQEYYKQEVYSLAVELGVPWEIINRAPTAGLWEGQTDEGEIGFSYEEIDKYLIRKKHGWAGTFDPKLSEKIDTLEKANLHKSQPIPFYKRNK